MKSHKTLRNVAAFILLAFGLVTLFLSTSIIFDLFEIREKEGNYVLFIVLANFICSIFYLVAANGFIKKSTWTSVLLAMATVVLIVAFILLLIHINNGGIYETKTVGAMIFRIFVTLVLAGVAYFTLNKGKKNSNE